jgi:hypothetical protein
MLLPAMAPGNVPSPSVGANSSPSVIVLSPANVSPESFHEKRASLSAVDTAFDSAAKKLKVTYTMFTFTFKNGNDPTHIEGAAAAAAFAKSYGQLIDVTRKFSVKARWMSYRAKLALQKTLPATVPNGEPASASNADDADVNRIIEQIAETRAVDCFHAWYMTTPDATIFVLTFRCCSVFGGDHWCWKPDLMCDILKSYMADASRASDPVLREAFQKLTYAAASNVDTVERYPLYSKYKDKKGVDQEAPVFRAYTFISIPVHKFSTQQEETKWIEQQCHSFLQCVRGIMVTNVFRGCMFRSKESLSKSIFNESLKTNLPKFLKEAIRRVSPMLDITDFLIPAASHILTLELMNSRQATMKYNVSSVAGQPVHDVDDGGGLEFEGGVAGDSDEDG